MPKDTYLQPDAPDPILESDVVVDLARRHVPKAELVTAVDESGGEARVYIIDDHLVVKTQRPHRVRPRTSLAKEAELLGVLQSVALPVPDLYGYGQVAGIEYLVMSRMPGVAVVHTSLPAEARQRMLFDLGRVLERLHTIPTDPLQEHGRFPTEDTMRCHVAEALNDGARYVVEAGAYWPFPDMSPDHVASYALAALPENDRRSVLHSNPGPTHTFVDAVTGSFNGLIDFGDAFISHPAWDLRRWAPQERAALLAGYEADRVTDPSFLQTYRIIAIAMDLVQLASEKSALRQAAEADLAEHLAELE